MKDIVNVPRALLTFTAANWSIDWRGQSAGANLQGVEQIQTNASPRYSGALSLSQQSEFALWWRAMRSYTRGRLKVMRFDMVDAVGNGAKTISANWSNGLSHSTGPRFSTGFGYSWEPFVVCEGGATSGASEITVTEGAHEVKPGQRMSYNDWPFDVISRTDNGDGTVTLGVARLATAIPDQDEIQMRAKGLFLATDDMTGAVAFAGSRFFAPEISLVEYLNR